MNYGEKVLERLISPGMLLLAIGAVMAYASPIFTRRIKEERREHINLIIKAVGCVMALAGALILLDLIG